MSLKRILCSLKQRHAHENRAEVDFQANVHEKDTGKQREDLLVMGQDPKIEDSMRDIDSSQNYPNVDKKTFQVYNDGNNYERVKRRDYQLKFPQDLVPDQMHWLTKTNQIQLATQWDRIQYKLSHHYSGHWSTQQDYSQLQPLWFEQILSNPFGFDSLHFTRGVDLPTKIQEGRRPRLKFGKIVPKLSRKTRTISVQGQLTTISEVYDTLIYPVKIVPQKTMFRGLRELATRKPIVKMIRQDQFIHYVPAIEQEQYQTQPVVSGLIFLKPFEMASIWETCGDKVEYKVQPLSLPTVSTTIPKPNHLKIIRRITLFSRYIAEWNLSILTLKNIKQTDQTMLSKISNQFTPKAMAFWNMKSINLDDFINKLVEMSDRLSTHKFSHIELKKAACAFVYLLFSNRPALMSMSQELMKETTFEGIIHKLIKWSRFNFSRIRRHLVFETGTSFVLSIFRVDEAYFCAHALSKWRITNSMSLESEREIWDYMNAVI